MRDGVHRGAQRPDGYLTARQREMVLLAACGLTQQQIARRCFVTRNTVHMHVSVARTKLGAHSLVHTLALAIHRGIITREELSAALEKQPA